MTSRRIQLGQQLHVAEETAEGLRLEGVARLHPEQLLELVPIADPEVSLPPRTASVISWSVARLGKEGPAYQGLCRWQ